MEMIEIYLVGACLTGLIVSKVCKNTLFEVQLVMCLTWPIFWLHFLYCLIND